MGNLKMLSVGVLTREIGRRGQRGYTALTIFVIRNRGASQ